jgi:hypothetical protein
LRFREPTRDSLVGQFHRSFQVTDCPRHALLAIKRAEGRVADLPTYRYKSANLAEQYSMAFFRPNKNDPKAIQYKADMTKMLEFLERIDGIKTLEIPFPQN